MERRIAEALVNLRQNVRDCLECDVQGRISSQGQVRGGGDLAGSTYYVYARLRNRPNDAHHVSYAPTHKDARKRVDRDKERTRSLEACLSP